jgi:hypothetical protein
MLGSNKGHRVRSSGGDVKGASTQQWHWHSSDILLSEHARGRLLAMATAPQ